MKKRFLMLITALIFVFCIPVYAENMGTSQAVSNPLTSDKFTIFIDVIPQECAILESSLKFDLKSLEDIPISSGEVLISNTNQVKIEFPVPTYEIGTKFKLTMTEGAQSRIFYTDTFFAGDSLL